MNITATSETKNVLDFPSWVKIDASKQAELEENLSKIKKLREIVDAEITRLSDEVIGAGEEIKREKFYAGDVDEGIALIREKYPQIDQILKDVKYENLLMKKKFDKEYLEEFAFRLMYLNKINDGIITESVLSKKEFGHMDIDELKKEFESIKNQRYVNIGSDFVRDMRKPALEVLIRALESARFVNIRANGIGNMKNPGLKILMNGLKKVNGVNLQSDEISKNMEKDELKTLAKGLSHMKYLDLCANDIANMTQDQLEIFVESFKNADYVNLGFTNIGKMQEPELRILFEGLKKVKYLGLGRNGLPDMDQGQFKILTENLQHAKHISMEGNDFHDRQKDLIQTELIDKGVKVGTDK